MLHHSIVSISACEHVSMDGIQKKLHGYRISYLVYINISKIITSNQ
jgi:hypothetical protein